MKGISTILPKCFFLFALSFVCIVSFAQIPTDGLIASFPFDGNANDESGNGYDGIVNEAVLVEDRFGNENGAYEFDGIDDYIDVANSSLVDGESELTVSCWLKRDDKSGYGLPIHAGNQGRFGFHIFNDTLKVNVSTNSTVSGASFTEFATSPTFFNQELWTNIILWYNGQHLRLYINGLLKDEITAQGILYTPQTSHLAFGVYMYFNNPNHGYYKGILDDVNIYNKALSETDIARLYGDFHNSNSTLAINQQDSLALVALFNATDGENWTTNENWLTGPVSSWYGIELADDRVEKIKLKSNYLVGNIPDEISQISNLDSLDLSNNELSGAIPSTIGNLKQLTSIVLYKNNLTGTIPIQLGDAVKLKNIRLGDNNLTGELPGEIANLSDLIAFSIYNNNIEGEIPISYGSNLKNLGLIELNKNEMYGAIPQNWGTLQSLIALNIENNNFSSLPDFSGLNQMVYFWVENNNFHFDDLEENASMVIPINDCSPQKTIGSPVTEIVNEGESHQYYVEVGGTQNVYNWYKEIGNGTVVYDTVKIPGQSTSSLTQLGCTPKYSLGFQ